MTLPLLKIYFQIAKIYFVKYLSLELSKLKNVQVSPAIFRRRQISFFSGKYMEKKLVVEIKILMGLR